MSWETTVSGIEAPDAPTAAAAARAEVVRNGYAVARVKRTRYRGDGRWDVSIVLAETPSLPSITVIRARSDA